jgi:hypothetical protein
MYKKSLAVGIVGLSALTALLPAVADEARDAGNAKSVDDLCTPILEARRGLRSGEMLIIRESWTLRDAKKDSRQAMLHFWFDGAKCRFEEIHEPFTDRNGKESPRNTENTCRGCYSDTTLVWHSDRPVSGQLAVIVNDIELTDLKRGRYKLPEPRLLGLGASGLHNCDWEEVDYWIRNKTRTDESIVREVFKGEECWKVEYRAKSPAPQEIPFAVRFWVSPKQGDSLIRMQSQSEFKDVGYITTLDCENQKSADAGLWYPRRLVWESGRVGAEPSHHEEAQVTLGSLNKPIDPVVFSFKGIRSITPGVFVHRESKEADPSFFTDQIVTIGGRDVHRATAVWNGEKLVSREEFEKSGNLP